MTSEAAKLYIRRNGAFGASCDGTQDIGVHVLEAGGRFTIWNADDELICEDVPRSEAEAAITEDWRRTSAVDWYDRRDELEPGMVFRSCYGIVKLDHRKPGDGTDWVVQTWYAGRPDVPGYERGHWSCDEDSIHPGDLTERLPDDFAGEPVPA